MIIIKLNYTMQWLYTYLKQSNASDNVFHV